MGSARTSIVLGVLAAALAGYVFFIDRGKISSGELDQRKGSVLPELVRARIEKVEIQRKGQTTVLARTLGSETDEEDEAALWRVQQPYQGKADQDAVDALLSELEWMQARRSMELSAADRKRFGLVAPRYRLWFTVGKTRVPLLLGNETPNGDGIYAQAGERNSALVVGKDVIEALNHEPEHYHSKEMYEGVLVGLALRLSLTDDQGARVLQKRADGLWRVQTPQLGFASEPVVTDIITAVDALRAKRFVAQAAKDLARYGLDRPNLDLVVTTTRLVSSAQQTKKPGQASEPKREEVPLRLRIGSTCEGHPDERYARVDDTRVVYCVLDVDVAKLRPSLQTLREARLLPLADEDIESIRVQHGAAQIFLRKKDELFSYEATRHEGKPLTGEARVGSVEEWIKALRATEALRLDGAPLKVSKSDLVTLQVARKDKPLFEIRIDVRPGREPMAQRDDEPSSIALPAEMLMLLEASAARFRKLDLLKVPESALREIELRHSGEIKRFTRATSAASFTLEGAAGQEGDRVALDESVRLLSALTAERFVADAPQAEHALSAPTLVVVFTRAAGEGETQPKRFTLRLGAETQGGRYAELEGQPGVFVANTQLVTALTTLTAPN